MPLKGGKTHRTEMIEIFNYVGSTEIRSINVYPLFESVIRLEPESKGLIHPAEASREQCQVSCAVRFFLLVYPVHPVHPVKYALSC
jgi:hypothetical protein